MDVKRFVEGLKVVDSQTGKEIDPVHWGITGTGFIMVYGRDAVNPWRPDYNYRFRLKRTKLKKEGGIKYRSSIQLLAEKIVQHPHIARVLDQGNQDHESITLLIADILEQETNRYFQLADSPKGESLETFQKKGRRNGRAS